MFSLDRLTIRPLAHRTDDADQAMIQPAQRARFWLSAGGLTIALLAIMAVGLIA